jgi:hypothetical protein
LGNTHFLTNKLLSERLKEINAGLRSLAEPWADTTSPAGRMVLTIFAGIADFERSLIGERTSAGRAAAKAKGVRFGPKPVLTHEQITHARRLIDKGQSVSEVARCFVNPHSNSPVPGEKCPVSIFETPLRAQTRHLNGFIIFTPALLSK